MSNPGQLRGRDRDYVPNNDALTPQPTPQPRLPNGINIDLTDTTTSPTNVSPGSRQLSTYLYPIRAATPLTVLQCAAIALVEPDALHWCSICSTPVVEYDTHISQHSLFLFPTPGQLSSCTRCFSSFRSQLELDLHQLHPFCSKSDNYVKTVVHQIDGLIGKLVLANGFTLDLSITSRLPDFPHDGSAQFHAFITPLLQAGFTSSQHADMLQNMATAGKWCSICNAVVGSGSIRLEAHIKSHSAFFYPVQDAERHHKCPSCYLSLTATGRDYHQNSLYCPLSTNYKAYFPPPSVMLQIVSNLRQNQLVVISQQLSQFASNVIRNRSRFPSVLVANNSNGAANGNNAAIVHVVNNAANGINAANNVVNNISNVNNVVNNANGNNDIVVHNVVNNANVATNGDNDIVVQSISNHLLQLNGVISLSNNDTVNLLNLAQLPANPLIGSDEIAKHICLLEKETKLTIQQINNVRSIAADATHWCAICCSAVTSPIRHIQDHALYLYPSNNAVPRWVCSACFCCFESQTHLQIHQASPFCVNSHNHGQFSATLTQINNNRQSWTLSNGLKLVLSNTASLANHTAIGSAQLEAFTSTLKTCGIKDDVYCQLKSNHKRWCFVCAQPIKNVLNQRSHIAYHSHFFYRSNVDNTHTCQHCCLAFINGHLKEKHAESRYCPASPNYDPFTLNMGVVKKQINQNLTTNNIQNNPQ